MKKFGSNQRNTLVTGSVWLRGQEPSLGAGEAVTGLGHGAGRGQGTEGTIARDWRDGLGTAATDRSWQQREGDSRGSRDSSDGQGTAGDSSGLQGTAGTAGDSSDGQGTAAGSRGQQRTASALPFTFPDLLPWVV